MSTVPAQPAAQPIDVEITGTLQGAEQRKAGWMRFAVLEDGKQYPRSFDTKKEEIIAQALSLLGQRVTVQGRESESDKINEQSGKPYINRYLNAIALAGTVPGVVVYQQATATGQPTTGQPVVQQTPAAPQIQPGIMGYDKDINIMRQTASKVVAMSLAALPEDQRTVEGMVAACEAWMAYYIYGPLRFGVTAFDQRDTPGDTSQAAPAAAATATTDGQADWDGTGKCPDCGFTGQHSLNCPRGEYV